MKNMKRTIAIIATVGVIGTAGIAFAATVKTPAEITSELTGKTIQELYEAKEEGKTFGTIANEAGKLEEFKQQMLDNKKSILDQRVSEGRLSQEEADKIYSAIEENQSVCDGSGSGMIGRANGACFGNGQGAGMGKGQGFGRGAGMRNGRGLSR